jgi:transposase
MIQNEVLNEKTRRKHSSEFKREAVALVIEHGYLCAEAGRSLNVNANLISRWMQKFENDETSAFPGKGKRTADQQRIHELEKENRKLRMEKAEVSLTYRTLLEIITAICKKTVA